MNKFFNDLQQEARRIKLSTEEKQAMRVHLYKVMGGATPVRPIPSMYYWFSPRFSIPTAVLLLIGLSGGTAFAAQSALPGDPLYAIKVNVTEQVQGALATTPKAKAEWHAQVAQTRLEEGEALAASGKLTATTSDELATNFDAHAEAAQAIADTLKQEDPGSAAELTATFDSALSAHGAILAQLGEDSADQGTKDNSGQLAQHVREQEHSDVALAAAVPQAAGAPVKTFAAKEALQPTLMNAAADISSAEATNTPEDASTTIRNQTVALALQAQASTTLLQAQSDFAKIQSSLNAATTAQVQAQLTSAEALLASAAAALQAGDYAGAKQDFARVVHAAVRLDAYLKAGKKFDGTFLSSLLTNGETHQPIKGDSGKGSGDTENIQSSDATSSVSSTVSSGTDSSVDVETVHAEGNSQVHIQINH